MNAQNEYEKIYSEIERIKHSKMSEENKKVLIKDLNYKLEYLINNDPSIPF